MLTLYNKRDISSTTRYLSFFIFEMVLLLFQSWNIIFSVFFNVVSENRIRFAHFADEMVQKSV